MHEGLRHCGLPLDPASTAVWLPEMLRMSVHSQLGDGYEVHRFRQSARLNVICYTDPSHKICCCHSVLRGRSVIEPRGVSIERINQCRFCDLMVIDVTKPWGSLQLRFQAADINWQRRPVELGRVTKVCLTAWGVQTSVYDGEPSLQAAHAGDPRGDDGEFLRPVGPGTLLAYSRGSGGGPARDARLYMTAVVSAGPPEERHDRGDHVHSLRGRGGRRRIRSDSRRRSVPCGHTAQGAPD